MQSILFAILVVISVNIQPAEAQSEKTELEDSLQKLDEAIKKAQSAMSNANRLIKESGKEDLVGVLLKRMEQLKEELSIQDLSMEGMDIRLRDVRRKAIEAGKDPENIIMSMNTTSEIRGIRDYFYDISEALERRIRQFEEAKRASVNIQPAEAQSEEQKREDSLKKLNKAFKKAQSAMSNARKVIEEFQKEQLVGIVVWMRMEQLQEVLYQQDEDIKLLKADIGKFTKANFTRIWEIRYLSGLFTTYHKTLERRIRQFEKTKQASVNIQLRTQYEKQGLENSLQELDGAIEKAQSAMSNANRVIKESENKELAEAAQKQMEQLKAVLRDQDKDIKLLDEDVRRVTEATGTWGIWEIRYLMDCFYNISNELNKHILQFEGAKQASGIFNQKISLKRAVQLEKLKQVASLVSAFFSKCSRAFGKIKSLKKH